MPLVVWYHLAWVWLSCTQNTSASSSASRCTLNCTCLHTLCILSLARRQNLRSILLVVTHWSKLKSNKWDKAFSKMWACISVWRSGPYSFSSLLCLWRSWDWVLGVVEIDRSRFVLVLGIPSCAWLRCAAILIRWRRRWDVLLQLRNLIHFYSISLYLSITHAPMTIM